MRNIFGEKKLIKQRKPQRDERKTQQPDIAEKLLYLMEMFKV